MDLQKMIKLWPQYQSWLKENGITMDNAADKIPGLIGQLNSDPQKAAQVSSVINSQELATLAKNFNVKDSDFQQMKNAIQPNNAGLFGSSAPAPTTSTFAGNLTPEQMELIKKFKR